MFSGPALDGMTNVFAEGRPTESPSASNEARAQDLHVIGPKLYHGPTKTSNDDTTSPNSILRAYTKTNPLLVNFIFMGKEKCKLFILDLEIIVAI